MLQTTLIRKLRPYLPNHPRLKKALEWSGAAQKLIKHTAGELVPAVIRPAPERLTVAITAKCNLRCLGCRYGRDYMPGAELPKQIVFNLLEDAAEAGFPRVRLYGGEPLLHRHLPQFVERSAQLGLKPVITTNGILLKERIGELYRAGLRLATIGYYGFGESYDEYVSAPGGFSRLERSIASVRDRYGMTIDLQINVLLTKQTCSAPLLRQAWSFARKYSMYFQLDLVHYSLPYFTEGPDGSLQFTPSDQSRLVEITKELLAIRAEAPALFAESERSIRSIPDWALKGSRMEVPCDAYKMLWVGADGSVRLCYVTFPLGNLHEKRLREMFGSAEHRQACRDAFQLKCPHCHCERGSRIDSHLASRHRYGAARWAPDAPPEKSEGSHHPFPILQ